MGSIRRRLVFVWTIGAFLPLLATAVFAALPEFANGMLLLKAGLFWVALLVYATSVLLSVRPRSVAERGSDFLATVRHAETEYCLVLRPFGADGFIPLLMEPRRWSRIGKWAFGGLRPAHTLEAVLTDAVRDHLACETVALVDPQCSVVPAGPHYLSASDAEWQELVDQLIRRALVVVFVLPPRRPVSDSLIWEVGRSIALGLTGRAVVFLPPQRLTATRKPSPLSRNSRHCSRDSRRSPTTRSPSTWSRTSEFECGFRTARRRA